MAGWLEFGTGPDKGSYSSIPGLVGFVGISAATLMCVVFGDVNGFW